MAQEDQVVEVSGDDEKANAVVKQSRHLFPLCSRGSASLVGRF